AHGNTGIGHAELFRHSATDAHKPALSVFEVNRIGDVVQQRMQQVTLALQGEFGSLAIAGIPKQKLDAGDTIIRVAKGSLDDLHLNALTAERDIVHELVDDISGAQDALVVSGELYRQVVGEEIAVGLADDLGSFVSVVLVIGEIGVVPASGEVFQQEI